LLADADPGLVAAEARGVEVEVSLVLRWTSPGR
jgi:hypothetical protein